MPSPTKRTVLEPLLKKRLAQLSRAFGIEASSTWSKGDHVGALVEARAVKLPDLLEQLTIEEQRDVCRAHGVDDGGRAKAELVARLLGSPSAASEAKPRREPKQIELLTAAPSKEITVRRFGSFSEITSFLWSVADLLRGDYRQSDYGKVVLPMTVLRRLDCVLAPTKAKALAKHVALQGGSVKNLEPVLNRITELPFHNVSPFDFSKLLGDTDHIAANVKSYINGFSESVREVFIDRFKLPEQLDKLDQSNLLFQVVKKFAEVDLHPDHVSNHDMGLVYEELIRRFAELSNETAGEHFTPREVIRLMVDLLFDQDADVLSANRPIRTLFDPACGTGGMLSVGAEYVRELNPDAELQVFGQELNDESFAICKSDMMIKGSNPEHIVRGNSFSEDGHEGRRFDYMLSNPPFGVEWKKVEKAITDEHARGDAGRFGPGLPRISDGSLLFLLHMVSKMKPAAEGSRIAIVFNGSPLFTGDAGSGESEIRKWLLEHDMLEAIIGLPDQLFYNTGISTYVWLVTNRKAPERKGKVQLVDATKMFQKMRKSLGNKRNEIGDEHRREIVRLYHERVEGKTSKIFDNEDFGFAKITVERPLRLSFAVSEERIGRLVQDSGFAKLATSKKKGKAGEAEVDEGKALQEQVLAVLRGMDQGAMWRSREGFEEALGQALEAAEVKLSAAVKKAVVRALGERDETAEPCRGADGRLEPDPELRDTENVPLGESIAEYLEREVRPHVPDGWVDEEKTKIGYEIPFTRHFYEYVAPRGVEEIEREIRELEEEIRGMLEGVLG